MVHGLPEPAMDEGAELLLGGQPFDGLTLPLGPVALDVVDRPRRQHEEASAHPRPVALGLLAEPDDTVAAHREGSEATRRLHGGDRGERTLRAMERHEPADVYLGHAV